MVYDGDCHFCMRWIKRWQKTPGHAVEYAPLQKASPDFPEIPRVGGGPYEFGVPGARHAIMPGEGAEVPEKQPSVVSSP